MQGDGTVDDRVMADLVHVRVHIGICKTEDHGFVAYQSLIVAFHIGDGLFAGAAQAHIAPHLVDIPELILSLYCLDPHIGKAHAQTEVEADAAVLDGQAHTGHTGHILGDGDGLGVHLADQLVGQLQVGNGIGVGIVGEVLIVGVKASSLT